MPFPAFPTATVAPPPVHAPADARFFHYAGARAPDRQRRIDANGVGLAVYEWGAADAPPPLLLHRPPRFSPSAAPRAPDRQRRIDANGVGLAVYEWGAADAPPVLLVHGALDFARTFDVF